MSLHDFARREMELAGMCGEAWSEGRLFARILELIDTFRSHGHSGSSGMVCLSILNAIGWEQARTTEFKHADVEVQDVIDVYAKQEYRNDKDAEFAYTRFLHLARFQPLGAGGSLDVEAFKPSVDFANDVTEYFDTKGHVQTVYQSTRKSSVFSADGGATWYDIDRPGWSYPKGCTPTPMPGNA